MKRTALIAIALLPLFALAQSNNFSIRGKIGKLNAPATAYLYFDTGGKYVLDSVVLNKGVFEFKGSVSAPVRGMFVLDEKGAGMRNAGNRFNVYIEPGVIKITSPDSAAHIKISGTKLNNELDQLKASLKPVSDQLGKLKKTDTGIDAGIRQSLLQKREAIMTQFIKTHTGSFVSFDALKDMGGITPDPEKIEPLYDLLSDSLKNIKAIKDYYTRLQDLKKTAIGKIAPDFTQADTAGNNVSLHDFKGKYVLLDFWASWCKPCRHENPAVVSAFNKYKDKGFTIVSVSLDAPNAKDKWLKAIHDDGLTGWTHVSDLNFWSNAVAQLYSIQSIPMNFLLDKDGKIIAKNLRGDELATRLHEVLDSN